MNQSLQFSITSDTNEFISLRDAWNRLASSNPLLSWDWLHSWWKFYHHGNELLIIVLRDDSGEVVGIVPWYKTVAAGGARVIRCLGNGEACSDYMSIVCDEQDRAHIERTVANSILESTSLQRRLARWDYIEIEGHDDRSYGNFFDEMNGHGCGIYRRPIEGCWVAELNGSFEEFESRMHKSFRRKVKKARKNLSQPDIHIDFIEDEAALNKHWKSFCNLHQKRRQLLGDPGCFRDSRFEKFLREAAIRLIRRGKSRLARVKHGDQDIGFILTFLSETGCWMYQSGMDPDHSRWEPGHMMTTALVQKSYEDRLRSYDFMRGDEGYKRFWNTTRIPLYKTRVVAPTPSARIRHNIWVAGRSVKRGMFSLANRVQSTAANRN